MKGSRVDSRLNAVTNESQPIKFYRIGRQRGYYLTVGRARFVLSFWASGERWSQRGDDSVRMGKLVREIAPLQILLETGIDPWHYPLTREDRVRYEERGYKMKMEGLLESGGTE